MNIEQSRNNHNDDEIDLIELMVELWKGKVIILAFILVCLAAGIGYIKLKPTTYSVSASYAINLYPQSVMDLCGAGNKNCLDQAVLEHFLALGSNWQAANNAISIGGASQTIQNIGVISSELEDVNKKLTATFLEQAKDELSLIQGLSPDLQRTEAVATSVLHAKRMIDTIEKSNTKALTVSKPVVSENKPKAKLIVVISFLLGLIFGVVSVLLRKAFLDYRSRSAN